jgi:hypothetical protein
MEKLFTYLSVLMARFIVVGLFSFLYITPLFILFYLIIFQNLELLNEITLKNYLISYFVGFSLIYRNTMKEVRKDEKAVNKEMRK